MANKETTVKSKLKINYATKTQIDKVPSLSETEMYIVDPEYAGNKVLVTDRKADIVESIVTDAELEAVHGISGNIQEQLNEEKEARIAKDTELRNDLDAEVQRATDQDNAHTDAINTLTANLATEIERSTQRDNELTNALSAEELRAKGVEEGLRTDLGNPANLTTTSKTNTVSAINELNANKQNNITGAITTVLDTDLVRERVLISNENGKVTVSNVTNTELSYISGVTSSVQTQLNAKVNDADISAVGKSNDYNDLDNKPTIGNATITFKANGATVTGQSFTTNATSNVEIDLGNTSLVDDVKVNNTSIVSNKIANIPLASSDAFGVVKTDSSKGISVTSGVLETIKASDSEIVAKTQNYKPIVPSLVDIAVREGLGNNTLTWTDTYKASARNTIGAEAQATIQTLSATDSITLADNTIYNGGTQTSLTIALPSNVDVSFLAEIDFSSGATPTTLEYPQSGINWLGDDIVGGLFVPVENKRYTIICAYNGSSYNFVVKGV